MGEALAIAYIVALVLLVTWAHFTDPCRGHQH